MYLTNPKTYTHTHTHTQQIYVRFKYPFNIDITFIVALKSHILRQEM